MRLIPRQFQRFGATRIALPLFVLLGVLTAGSVSAQAPPGYYDTVDPSTPAALRATLHGVIDDHTRFPYTSGSTDTWDILEEADEDPDDDTRVLDVYKNASYQKEGGGNSFYNREHSWPNSYGFPDDGSDNYPFTDCHLLFLCDSSYNSSRSNKPFRTCDAGCLEKTTDSNGGEGGGSGSYPGNSNWTEGSFTQGKWEVWHDRRGDIARAQLYADVRYEGGNHGTTGHAEPDLILTDIESLMDNSRTGQNEPVAYMGELTVLLQWHAQDPPDAKEIHRNNVIFGHQGNRNPFIDHPEWVECIFEGSCGPVPLVLNGPSNVSTGDTLDFDWTSPYPSEPYWLYWSKSLGGTTINGTAFDIGPRINVLATGTTQPDGSGAWHSGRMPLGHGTRLSRRTLYFELRVDSGGQTFDSNAVSTQFQ